MTGFLAAMGSTIGVVFLAELGDKSQMIALGLGTRHRLAPLVIGGLLAAAISMALSVLVGGLLGAALPTAAVTLAGGLVFLGFGLWGLWPRAESARTVAEEAAVSVGPTPRLGLRAWGPSVVTAFTTILIAEFGDKTMLVTATLATRSDQVAVWLGATLALSANVALGAAIGRLLEGRISRRRLEIASGALFALIGLLLVLDGLRA